MALAAKRRRKKKLTRGQFWGLVLSASVAAALCLLITISGRMSEPFLPTWEELLGYIDGADKPGQPLDTELEVHVIDVGNADSILVRNKGMNLLIDAGERNDGERVAAYLEDHGIKKLDMVIATHADADHIGGMKTVIQRLEIGAFIMAFMPEGYTPTTSTYAGMLEALADKGVKITPAKAGARYSLGDAWVDILGPAGEFEDNNNQSVVCKVTFGSRKFLFMGDAEKEAERALLAAGTDLSADVLKAGHHGSRSSTTAELLEAVQPTYVLLTCGVDNSYGHPHAETVARLKEAGVTIYRSDADGTVVIATDGETLRVQTEK